MHDALIVHGDVPTPDLHVVHILLLLIYLGDQRVTALIISPALRDLHRRMGAELLLGVAPFTTQQRNQPLQKASI
jgi:hypothetical protein